MAEDFGRVLGWHMYAIADVTAYELRRIVEQSDSYAEAIKMIKDEEAKTHLMRRVNDRLDDSRTDFSDLMTKAALKFVLGASDAFGNADEKWSPERMLVHDALQLVAPPQLAAYKVTGCLCGHIRNAHMDGEDRCILDCDCQEFVPSFMGVRP